MNRVFGWIFRPFNRLFERELGRLSGRGVAQPGSPRRRVRGLLGAARADRLHVPAVPGGFIPIQDKLYLIAAKLPEGASLDRTEALAARGHGHRAEDRRRRARGPFPGFNALQFTNTPNTGVSFLARAVRDAHRSAHDIAAELNGQFAGIKEGFAFALMPPPVLGLGTGSGYSLYVQDRTGAGYGALQNALGALPGAVADAGHGFPISSYQANVPQLDCSVDRTKAKAQGIALTDLFETMQVYLGSALRQRLQPVRPHLPRDRAGRRRVSRRRRRHREPAHAQRRGEMVPIGTVAQFDAAFGPDPVIRYNGYPAADLIGETDPRVCRPRRRWPCRSDCAAKVLPAGMTTEWTDLSYQQTTQGNAALVVFPLAVLLVFLVLAALYESWVLPLAVILIVPMCLLAALFGVWLTGGDNNIFVQVGLVVLMGLACKNAILIVEFARELEMEGKGIVEAALEACRLRLRPIVMTSVAFIAGVVPLVIASGAGAEVRARHGITVFAGMIGVTLFGLLLTPVFYVGLRKLVHASAAARAHAPAE